MEFLSKDQFIDSIACDVYCEPEDIVAIRLFVDEYDVDTPFTIDGIDAEGVYSEGTYRFATKQAALDAIYAFCVEFHIDTNTPVQDMTSED